MLVAHSEHESTGCLLLINTFAALAQVIMDNLSPGKSPMAVPWASWMMHRRRRVVKVFALSFCLTSLYWCLTAYVPDAWREADLTHVVRVIADTQSFDLETMNDGRQRQRILDQLFLARPEYRDRRSGDITIHTVVSEFAQRPQKAFYPEFFSELRRLKSLYEKNRLVQKSVETLSIFQPILTQQEKSELLLAFDVFSRVCQDAGVTYFLLEASLMGVRRHHGMIPWDDDIDIVVNVSQWKTLYVLLSSIPGFEVYAPSSHQWKFYVNTSLSFRDKPFKFPYLDIFFFSEDAEFVWAVTGGLKHDLVHRKPDIFPLRWCPFEERRVPVPNNLPLLVDASHDVNECITGEYNHKTNERFYFGGKVRVPCSALTMVYPFVFRETNSDGSVLEKLQVGTKLLNMFVYKP